MWTLRPSSITAAATLGYSNVPPSLLCGYLISRPLGNLEIGDGKLKLIPRALRRLSSKNASKMEFSGIKVPLKRCDFTKLVSYKNVDTSNILLASRHRTLVSDITTAIHLETPQQFSECINNLYDKRYKAIDYKINQKSFISGRQLTSLLQPIPIPLLRRRRRQLSPTATNLLISDESGKSGKSSTTSSQSRNSHRQQPPPKSFVISLEQLLILALFVCFPILSTFINDMEIIESEISLIEFLKEYVLLGRVDKIHIIDKTTVRAVLRDGTSDNNEIIQSNNHIIRSNNHIIGSNNHNDDVNQSTDMTTAVDVSKTYITSHWLTLRNFLMNTSVKRKKVIQFYIGDATYFENRMNQYQKELGHEPNGFIPIHYTTKSNITSQIKTVVPEVLTIFLCVLILRRATAVIEKQSSSSIDRYLKTMKANPSTASDVKSLVTFKDVAGMAECKFEVKEFVDFLTEPSKYLMLGATVPKGALLVGPPGTGKTLLAKAVAGEAKVPFYSMTGSDFMELFVGVGPSRVRDLFAQARENAPAIIFIDEIDAIGRRRARGGFSVSNDERESTLNQLLVEMDGFISSEGILVLAGTNRVDILDKALLRPGRFDRIISINLPEVAERNEIANLFLKLLTLHSTLTMDVAAEHIANLTPGFSGADLRYLCNEAAICAGRRGGIDGVILEDIDNAIDRIIGGVKSSHILLPNHKRCVAFHEAGHAVVSWFLSQADSIVKVSIIPRGAGLGQTQLLPDESPLFTKSHLLNKIAVLLGGRISEELFVGEASTGASDDLFKATKIAYSIVAKYGMSENVGLMVLPQGSEGAYRPYSEKTAHLIDNEAKELVSQQYDRVKTLIQKHQHALKRLADALFIEETISGNRLEEILGKRQDKDL